MKKEKIIQNQWLFVDESGKPEVYSAKGENLVLNCYKIVKNKIGKIQDICNKKYFTRSNPLELSS